MATPEVGKIYVPANAEEITRDFLDDLYLAAQSAGIADPPTQPGTDWHTLGTALGNALLLQYANLRIAEDNADILTATGDALEDKREAYGLPEVNPTGSSGKITVRVDGGGTATIPAGRELTLPNGLRLRVVGTWSGVVDRADIDVEAIDTGEATNAASGTEVKFVSPPLNVQEKAKVSVSFPLSGGTSAETDPRKRTRLLNRFRYQPGGGNWADLREIALNSLISIRDAYVYPALGGPASVKVVVAKGFDASVNDYSRAPSSAQVAEVRKQIQARIPTEIDCYVQAVADQNVDVALQVTLPDSTLSGGSGLGWLDSTPWPALVGADSGRVTVTAVSLSTSIIVSANTTTAPVAGQSRIAWWSSADKRFRIYTIISQSGSAGSWSIMVDKPMIDSTGATVAIGDFICPASERSADYGTSWLAITESLGAGENTSDVNRLPRSKRHPYVEKESPSGLTFALLKTLANQYDEITEVAYSYRSLTAPSVPGSVDTAPNVLRLRHLGIYKT